MRPLLVHSFLLLINIARASIAIQYAPGVQQPYGTVSAASASYTGAATYDNAILTPPSLPNPPPPTTFDVQLQTGAVSGLSIPQQSSFFGFSIELSVATSVFGLNSSLLQVPLLSLMANIRERAGSIPIRLGDNTEDYATLIDSTQDDDYNPFTPPVTNQSSFHQWTVGPVYYSAFFVPETLGSSNQSQVLDLQMNGGNEFTPGYAIYENEQPARVALINFLDDNSGASDYTASISIGGAVPSQVKVKFLSASSVTQKYNFTWAGQTFGDVFRSDGRPVGTVDIQTIACDQAKNVCNVKVLAPGAALVFLSDQALAELDPGPTMTFPTPVQTQLHNTATVDPSVLVTSNGNKGIAGALAGTTPGGGVNGAFGLAHALPGVGALVAGALLITRMNMTW